MLRKIQTFQAVVRLGSFTEAAEVCHISQYAVSQQVQALEREPGFPLLERRGYRLLFLRSASTRNLTRRHFIRAFFRKRLFAQILKRIPVCGFVPCKPRTGILLVFSFLLPFCAAQKFQAAVLCAKEALSAEA